MNRRAPLICETTVKLFSEEWISLLGERLWQKDRKNGKNHTAISDQNWTESNYYRSLPQFHPPLWQDSEERKREEVLGKKRTQCHWIKPSLRSWLWSIKLHNVAISNTNIEDRHSGAWSRGMTWMWPVSILYI